MSSKKEEKGERQYLYSVTSKDVKKVENLVK